MVNATGWSFTATLHYCAMASKDARAKAFINEKWLLRERTESIYNESVKSLGYHYDAMTMIANEDIAIGLAFKVESLPAFDGTVLLISYKFPGDDFGSTTKDDGLFPDEKTPTSLYAAGINERAPIEVGPNPFDNELRISGLQDDSACFN